MRWPRWRSPCTRVFCPEADSFATHHGSANELGGALVAGNSWISTYALERPNGAPGVTFTGARQGPYVRQHGVRAMVEASASSVHTVPPGVSTQAFVNATRLQYAEPRPPGLSVGQPWFLPKCGAGPFDEDYRTFKCRSCGLIIWKTMAGRLFETGEVEQLLTQGRVGPLEGFRSKIGRPFNAIVKLSEDFKQEFDFGEGANGAPEKIDASRHESIGICPVCKEGQVFELENAYICERSAAVPKKCTFRVSKTILHHKRDQPGMMIVYMYQTGLMLPPAYPIHHSNLEGGVSF